MRDDEVSLELNHFSLGDIDVFELSKTCANSIDWQMPLDNAIYDFS